jgi:hypothetical protein
MHWDRCSQPHVLHSMAPWRPSSGHLQALGPVLTNAEHGDMGVDHGSEGFHRRVPQCQTLEMWPDAVSCPG